MTPVIAFVVLVIVGLWMRELTFTAAGAFLGLWMLGYFFAGLFSAASGICVGITVLLDFVLILMIFKGDIPIR